jgi:hypothetical protein
MFLRPFIHDNKFTNNIHFQHKCKFSMVWNFIFLSSEHTPVSTYILFRAEMHIVNSQDYAMSRVRYLR